MYAPPGLNAIPFAESLPEMVRQTREVITSHRKNVPLKAALLVQ